MHPDIIEEMNDESYGQRVIMQQCSDAWRPNVRYPETVPSKYPPDPNAYASLYVNADASAAVQHQQCEDMKITKQCVS